MLTALEFTAVVVAAVYGILRANRKEMDFVGVFSIAFAAAFGGGTLRDLCLNRHPLFWIASDHYPPIVFALALLGSIFPRTAARMEEWLVIPDALGLGLFSIVGTAAALEAGTSLFNAALFGVVTGTFGGVIADVACNEIPSLFRKSPLYATCAFCGSWTYILIDMSPLSLPFAALGGITVTVILRLAAVHWNLSLPTSRSR